MYILRVGIMDVMVRQRAGGEREKEMRRLANGPIMQLLAQRLNSARILGQKLGGGPDVFVDLKTGSMRVRGKVITGERIAELGPRLGMQLERAITAIMKEAVEDFEGFFDYMALVTMGNTEKWEFTTTSGVSSVAAVEQLAQGWSDKEWEFANAMKKVCVWVMYACL